MEDHFLAEGSQPPSRTSRSAARQSESTLPCVVILPGDGAGPCGLRAAGPRSAFVGRPPAPARRVRGSLGSGRFESHFAAAAAAAAASSAAARARSRPSRSDATVSPACAFRVCAGPRLWTLSLASCATRRITGPRHLNCDIEHVHWNETLGLLVQEVPAHAAKGEPAATDGAVVQR